MKENLIEAAKKHVQELMKSNDPSHDWYHVERVYKNACYLAEQESLLNKDLHLDLNVIELAALFHDIVDFKYDHEKLISLEEIANERLNNFFTNYKEELSDEQTKKIIFIILNISWRKELEAGRNQENIMHELKIVRDADRLDAIGAVGIARCFGFSGAKNRPFFVEDLKPIENMTAEQYNNQTIKNQSTAVNHFYEKLFLLKDRILTQTGRKIAEKRHDFMVAYIKQFENECLLKA